MPAEADLRHQGGEGPGQQACRSVSRCCICYTRSMTTNLELADNYKQVLASIKERVQPAQYVALKAVNTELIVTCWEEIFDISPLTVSEVG